MKIQEKYADLHQVDAGKFWQLAHQPQGLPIIDVRSPGEFTNGHIPNAHNVPLFNNRQRAEIGTIYTRQGREPAVELGLEYAGQRLESLITKSTELARGTEILVHCWRGGMRSQSFAQVLDMAGLNPIVLKGGYKAFRKHALEQITQPHNLVVVSGLTGSGKTEVLRKLHAYGQQIIDLEAIANHRGSSFGGIGQGSQPTTEQFENELFASLNSLDPTRQIWIEDEGNRIGSVVVTPALYRMIQTAPAVMIHCSAESRIQNLLLDYGELPPSQLIAGIQRISKRLGGLATRQAVEAVSDGNVAAAIEICLVYYDKTYRTAIRTMPRELRVDVDIEGLDDTELVNRLIEAAAAFQNQKT